VAVAEDFGDTAMLNVADAEAALESFALIANDETPATVGVPAIVPVRAFNINPTGKCPLLTLHV
jgi:hypothetical protein